MISKLPFQLHSLHFNQSLVWLDAGGWGLCVCNDHTRNMHTYWFHTEPRVENTFLKQSVESSVKTERLLSGITWENVDLAVWNVLHVWHKDRAAVLQKASSIAVISMKSSVACMKKRKHQDIMRSVDRRDMRQRSMDLRLALCTFCLFLSVSTTTLMVGWLI